MTISVPFLGIVNVPIQTYTTTYTPIAAGWELYGPSMEAMEFNAWGSGASFQGAKGNIFTRAHITPFSIGIFTGSLNTSVYGSCGWFNNILCVIGAVQGTFLPEPNGITTPLPLDGVGVTIPSPALTVLKVMPNLSNTTTPAPAINWGGTHAALGVLGARYSYRINLDDFCGVWDGVTNVQGTQVCPPFSGTNPLIGCIPNPSVQTSSIFIPSQVSNNTAPISLQSNLLQADQFQTAIFEAPASSTLDFNAFMHSATSILFFRPTSLGFLQINTDSITVNGVTLAGYGILILPNFAGYYLLKITGTDALSLTWATAPGKGQVFGAMGAAADLFMKWTTTASTLFISVAPVVLPTAPGVSTLRQRAWTYVLDGHTFYVLDLGSEGTFAYDITTQQWANFSTQGFTQWDAGNGVMWGNRIVAGDLLSSDVWEVAGSVTTDNAGVLPINHVVTGGLAARSRQFHSVEDVRLSVSKGQYDSASPGPVNLRYSDDGGQTWSPTFSDAIAPGKTQGALSFRSLGSFQAPGRIFEFSDSGGPIRIDGADVFIDNYDDDTTVDSPPPKG